MSDLATLRDNVALWVNFAPEETDQDFAGKTGNAWFAIDNAINWAYRNEVKQAVEEVGTMFLRHVFSFTWPSTSITLPLPTAIADHRVYAFMDETSTSPGDFLWIQQQEGSRQPTLFWRDRKTLQWGTTGPGEDKTITAFYIEEPNALVQPTDVPELVPARHHDLIETSAAVHLRILRDDTAPASWLSALQALRFSFWNDLFGGQPMYPARYSIVDPYLGNEA